MLGIVGFLAAAFGTFAALLTVAYRVVLSETYEDYRARRRAEGKPYSWWRFFWVMQAILFRTEKFAPITFAQSALIAVISLPPMALVLHFLL